MYEVMNVVINILKKKMSKLIYGMEGNKRYSVKDQSDGLLRQKSFLIHFQCITTQNVCKNG